ncbi:MAG: bifunctional demethylmenaquinone methyltransferase/2-methoxy-6-polyprenyl-1,4-benzoquinol methylase UbiE [bacterium]|nr:bifunctional demethylmenaquinone methyltransferase/2-methoxy-6-polyprenyl-1,4-benzoquinol methylase UbiE [bacterium]
MEYKAEKINPYNDVESKTGQVRQMFDSIAPAYDFMNRCMTMGIDKWWRRRAVRLVAKHRPQRLLDVATGTGDLAIQLCRTIKPQQIVGIDLSTGMLEIGRRKVAQQHLDHTITLEEGDCLNLRFADGEFDAVTVAYGVRNFEHLEQGYAEMHRVLAKGGMLCVVELSTPTNPIIKWFYDIYTRHIIPFIGRSKSKDARAYSYLPESIAAVPQGEAMLQIMRRVGFTDCRAIAMTFGTCSIYLGIK